MDGPGKRFLASLNGAKLLFHILSVEALSEQKFDIHRRRLILQFWLIRIEKPRKRKAKL
jgi:hypothetical protein